MIFITFVQDTIHIEVTRDMLRGLILRSVTFTFTFLFMQCYVNVFTCVFV